jgi:hypothetical protein
MLCSSSVQLRDALNQELLYYNPQLIVRWNQVWSAANAVERMEVPSGEDQTAARVKTRAGYAYNKAAAPARDDDLALATGVLPDLVNMNHVSSKHPSRLFRVAY